MNVESHANAIALSLSLIKISFKTTLLQEYFCLNRIDKRKYNQPNCLRSNDNGWEAPNYKKNQTMNNEWKINGIANRKSPPSREKDSQVEKRRS